MKSPTNTAPGIGRKLKRRILRAFGALPPGDFGDSPSYWEDRYKLGGNSGAGSYGRLARFKAEFLNRFVSEHEIRSVIEFGSGDGAQLALARYPTYIGVDISRTAIEHCRSLYSGKSEYQFVHTSEYDPQITADLALSLDVIYHLVEDEHFHDYMNRLFEAAGRFVVVYSSNWDERPVPHVRHRRFADWIASERSDFEQICFEPNPHPFDSRDPENTSFADFYVYQKTHR